MIHAIYIYFIINAFIAGSGATWKECLRDFLIGLPYHICDIAWSWIKGPIGALEIKTLYDLYFTDKFGVEKQFWIDILKSLYPKSNKYRRWVIRQIDKKYNYGITKSFHSL